MLHPLKLAFQFQSFIISAQNRILITVYNVMT